MRISLDEPRLMKGYAVRVDLNDKSLSFTANGRDKDWGHPMPDYTNSVMIIDSRRQRTRDFLDEHRRHYRTDNSYIIQYGNLDIDRALAFLDEFEQSPLRVSSPADLLAALQLISGGVEKVILARLFEFNAYNFCHSNSYIYNDRIRVFFFSG